MRTRNLLVGAVSLLLLGACGSPEGVADPPTESPTETAEPETGPHTSAEPDRVAETGEPSTTDATTEAATEDPTGPQTCGTVISVIGEELTVEIVSGAVDCVFAEDLLDTYYNDPPSVPEGSGAYVTIEDWECNSSSSQEPGRASTCRGPDDAVVVTLVAGTEPDGKAPSDGGPGPVCAQIDEPTLEQIFPDGAYDEARCQSYIDGENSIG